MKRIVFFVILLMAAVCNTAWAENYDFTSVTATGQTLYYKMMSRNTVAVTYPDEMPNPYSVHASPSGSIAIPSTVRHNETTFSVVSIDEYAFYGCGRMTAVIIPNTVTFIGERAFYGDTMLASITVPSSVVTIDRYAFGGCSRLTTVSLPNTVATLGEGAFFSCVRLDSIALPTSLTSVAEVCFYSCSRLRKVVIPESITAIGTYAFSGCNQLASLVLPGALATVGEGAFYSCTRLDSIVVPASVGSIGAYAFKDCSRLSRVTMRSETPFTLGQEAFDATTTILVPCDSKSAYLAEPSWSGYSSMMAELCAGASISYDFAAPALTRQLLYFSIVEPNAVKIRGVGLTDDDLRVCELPSTVRHDGIAYDVVGIDNRVFYQIDGIDRVVIPSSITSIGDSAFARCSAGTIVMQSATPPNVGRGVFTQNPDILVPCDKENNYYANASWRGYVALVAGFCEPLPSWDFESGDWGWTHDGYWTIDTGENNYRYIGLSSSSRRAHSGSYAFFCSNLRTDARLGSFSSNASTLRSRAIQIDNNPTLTPITISFYAFTLGFTGTATDAHYNTLVLEYATSPEGTWSEIWRLPQETGADAWRQYDVAFSDVISNPGTYYFRFVNTGEGYCSGIDDFRITTNPIVRNRVTVMVQMEQGEAMSRGMVSGNGFYTQGSTAIIAAGAFSGYRFSQWSDGSTAEQRTITVVSDTSFLATFVINSYDTTIYYHDTIYHDTLIREVVYDTFDVLDTIDVYDTIYHDSTVIRPVYDTIRIDTTVVQIVFDTVTVLDTAIVYDIHDSIEVNTIYDTATVYDTTYIFRDSVIARIIYDVRDTVVVHTRYDTMQVYDTTHVVHDSVIMHAIYDTTFVTYYILQDSLMITYDTMVFFQTLYDTIRVLPRDTITLIEVVHDTICPEVAAIGSVIENQPRVTIEGRQIILDECYGGTVNLYDMAGRLLATRANIYGSLMLTAPSTGVYLLRVAGGPAQKVIIKR